MTDSGQLRSAVTVPLGRRMWKKLAAEVAPAASASGLSAGLEAASSLVASMKLLRTLRIPPLHRSGADIRYGAMVGTPLPT